MSTVLRMARHSDPIYVLPYRDTEDEDDADDDSYEGVLGPAIKERLLQLQDLLDSVFQGWERSRLVENKRLIINGLDFSYLQNTLRRRYGY